MPRLLVLTPSHALQGGVERIIADLHDGLGAHGFDVVVGLARGARFHDPEAYRRAYPGLHSVVIDAGSGTRLGRLRGLRRVLSEVRPQVVLIARLFDAYEAVAALKLRSAHRHAEPPRLAVTIQATEPEYLQDLALYAPFVDLCVTSGQGLAAAAGRASGLPPECLLSVAGGVRPARQTAQHDDTRPLRLLYVGRLDQPQKRVLDLAAVLARLADLGVPWSARIVGDGPARAALASALAAAGLDSRVRLEGWSDLDRLYAEVYPQADVFLHCAAFEGITIAPREAMAHGVVPVVSRFPGLAEEGQFVEGASALTFAVGDVEGAAQAVARLHTDRALLRRLSRAARDSQQGVRSLAGSLLAWATALHAALARPARLGAQLPRLPAPTGRLARWGLPAGLAELLRRLARRQVRAADPGAEWPHCGSR